MKFDRITVKPEIMSGQPCLRGTRLTVRRVVEALAVYPERAQLKVDSPSSKTRTSVRRWPLPH